MISKILEWAKTGIKAKPSDSKISAGWLGNEKPRFDWENHRMNERDAILNEVVDVANSEKNNLSLVKKGGISAVNFRKMAFPDSEYNTFSYTNHFVDAVVTEHELWAITYDSSTTISTLEVTQLNDPTDKAVVKTSRLTEKYQRIAGDGTYVYVLKEAGTSPDVIINVEAFEIATRAHRPDWSQSANLGTSGTSAQPIIKVMTNGNLFCGGNWAGNKQAIIKESDGTILVSNNTGLSAGSRPDGECISLFNTVVFTIRNNSGTYDINSLTENSLSSVVSFPLLTGRLHIHLVSLGDVFCYSSYDNSTTTTLHFLGSVAQRYCSSVIVNSWGTGYVNIFGMVFDGQNMWLSLYMPDLGSGPVGSKNMLVRLPYLSLGLYQGNTTKNHYLSTVTNRDDWFRLISNTPLDVVGTHGGKAPLMFDGNSLYVNLYGVSVPAYNDKIFRFQNIFNR